MRVLVCGGRRYGNTERVHSRLDRLHREEMIDCVIEGDAPGVDRIAGYWAKKNRIDLRLWPADWKTHGNSAGPIRNQKMLDEGRPDKVMAFPGGVGTADMVRRAKSAGVPVIEITD